MLVRLQREKRDLTVNPMSGVQIEWPESDLKHWMISIDAPAESYYAGDVFTVELTFGPNWPDQAPRVEMVTPIVHPNIENRAVCINIIRGQYNPSLKVRNIIEGIINALINPNPDDPVNRGVALMQKTSLDQFRREVQKQVSLNVRARESHSD
jgi:ubiquitin-protein ligase